MYRPSLLSTVLAVVLCAVIAAPELLAQDDATHRLLPQSRLWVEGTSNKSDWTVEAQELDLVVQLKPGNEASEVQMARLTVPAERIVSEKSTIMDRLMHKALKADEHPEISFELVDASPMPVPEGSDASFALAATGRLTVAGETKEIELPLQGARLDDDRIRFTGQHTMLMSNYGMQPPSAMFGALRTGDEVTVHFDLLVEPVP